MSKTNLTDIALEILKNEIEGDMKLALQKMTPDYSMTWVYQGYDGKFFPRTKPDFQNLMRSAYKIKGRKYEIINVAESKDLVMLELIESYPDPKTKQIYTTPQIIVLEFKGNKIKVGRHYCDPRLSLKKLPKDYKKRIFADIKKTKVIK